MAPTSKGHGKCFCREWGRKIQSDLLPPLFLFFANGIISLSQFVLFFLMLHWQL